MWKYIVYLIIFAVSQWFLFATMNMSMPVARPPGSKFAFETQATRNQQLAVGKLLPQHVYETGDPCPTSIATYDPTRRRCIVRPEFLHVLADDFQSHSLPQLRAVSAVALMASTPEAQLGLPPVPDHVANKRTIDERLYDAVLALKQGARPEPRASSFYDQNGIPMYRNRKKRIVPWMKVTATDLIKNENYLRRLDIDDLGMHPIKRLKGASTLGAGSDAVYSVEFSVPSLIMTNRFNDIDTKHNIMSQNPRTVVQIPIIQIAPPQGETAQ